MNYRSVAHVLPAQALDMNGTIVKQPFPTQKVEQIDPFLLLHHFGPIEAEPGQVPLDVGPHPHRGFEPVTFLFQGGIRHKDSRNNEGILQGGDVQWMTAGRGIIHAERSSADFVKTGGTLEGIQLWINLPYAHKMAQPDYQDIKAANIPVWQSADQKVQVRVVAGTFRGLQGVARTFTDIEAYILHITRGGQVELPIDAAHNALLYLCGGQVQINANFDYGPEIALHFRNDGEGIALRAQQDSRILFLSGTPIGEPVAQYGPFVMTNQTELLEAMRDYQMGKMGFYID